MAHRLHDRDDGNDGLGSASRRVAVADHLDTGERAHTVMHAYHSLGIVRHQGETVLDGVETRLSAIGKLVFNLKTILPAELLPIVLLGFWQYEDDLQVGRILTKALQRPHQHWFAGYGQELLGDVAPHPQALPSSHNDYVIHD